MSHQISQKMVGARLRQFREQRKVSLRKLAELTEFSPSFISQVENGQASPSIGSLERIAGALGITLGEFFTAPGQAGDADLVVRSKSRSQITSSWSIAQIEALGPFGGGRALESVLITLASGGRSGKRPRAHAMEQFAFVLRGKVRLQVDETAYLLRAGDAVTILRRQERLWENEGPAPARILVVSARFMSQ
jgi:transcriptional regulator with XRE-family HTH domain